MVSDPFTTRVHDFGYELAITSSCSSDPFPNYFWVDPFEPLEVALLS